MTFQQIILALQNYWADRGCLIVQPWDVEKGAGTFNASTYLRALGPEPWRVAYVEPSRRPADGRYGENPNRVEKHHQFQVLLKPSPKDIQEQYLGSLRAIGIDPLVHDIRFVEDNWESPTLGAWGLGWEVWYDGMEITQFTYFQQCGGYELNPVAVELTYGLERIAMSLQNVENVYDLIWSGDVTYGDIRHSDEVQWSKHNFEAADIALHFRWFEEYKSECIRLCDAGLVIPAYDYAMRCSHVFNILDARGAIGVTERQAYILRVRDISKRCADAWVALRNELEHPLMRHAATLAEVPAVSALELGEAAPVTATGEGSGAFLLELGTEEIPARMAKKAATDLQKAIEKQLADWGVSYSGVRSDCTPRRLVVGIDALALRQEDRVETSKGPPTRIAFDAEGNKSRAGEAFYKKLLPGDEVYKEDGPKGEYLMVRRRLSGQAVGGLLAEALPKILAKLHWPKPMRWGTERQAFVRPVHWILAALDGQALPFGFAGVTAGLTSCGHRFHAPEAFQATTWDALEAGLAERHVVLSSQERTRQIRAAAEALAAEVSGLPVLDEGLITEVTHLCEYPVAMLGRFEPELLKLPRQAIVTPMRVHQRYIPIEDPSGTLLPNFVVIGGTEVADTAAVARGNARVLRARLADARFFYEQDLNEPLDALLPQLDTLVWLKKLGSTRQKAQRIEALVAAVGGDAEAQRTAHLCKADLVSSMVSEFADLQGIMGREYALAHGESSAVADGILEHYQPKSADDALPTTLTGTLVGLADRFDSIVGCFGIGLKPTGSKDPYALRRQSIAIINVLTHTQNDVPGDIEVWIDAAIAAYEGAVNADCKAQILDFFDDRTKFLHRESLPKDVVDAVVAVGAQRPRTVYAKIGALAAVRASGELEPILTTFKRVANITKDLPAGLRDISGLEEPAAKTLAAEFETSAAASGSPADLVRELARLRPHVDRFFDDVLVMADEETVRARRTGLLADIRDHFAGFADFTRIQDRK